MTTLFAWAIPAFVSGAPVDHTWVTTYDNTVTPYKSVSDVVASGQSYWFCWGTFHPQGAKVIGALGSRVNDMVRAQCLVEPNQPSHLVHPARGTIFNYGVDGVCHQLANQVLLSTGIGGATPLTVSAARGYQASIFLYGTYGLQTGAWRSKINNCTGGGARGAPNREVMGYVIAEEEPLLMKKSEPMDEFELHLRRTLGEKNLPLSEALLDLRRQIQAQARLTRDAQNGPLTVDEQNARNQEALDAAAKLLGRDKFIAIFGFSPENKINLIDVAIQDSIVGER